MSVKTYFDLYSIDFSKISDFKNAIQTFEDTSLKTNFQTAIEAKLFKGNLEKEKQMQGMFASVGQELPELTECITKKEACLKEFEGCDPFAVQDLVHQVLEIPTVSVCKAPLEEKECYFNAMRKSQFLTTSRSSLNEDFVIDIRAQVLRFFENNPNTDELNIGCGSAVDLYLGSCKFRKPNDHRENSLRIDLSAAAGPHLVVDMHNPTFWESIPDGRFKKISDHTYGYFLFESPSSEQTLLSIHRTLAEGGYLEIDHAFNPEHIALLAKCGFEARVDEKIAKKIDINR